MQGSTGFLETAQFYDSLNNWHAPKVQSPYTGDLANFGSFAIRRRHGATSIGNSHMWNVRLFGHLEIQREQEQPIRKFRSRSAASVLAYIALHIDRAVPREELCEAIWPDYDPELARSSLRTAVFSLRKQLEGNDETSTVIDADRTHVWLIPDSVATDYSRFTKAFKVSESSKDQTTIFQTSQEAVELARGQLLMGHEETWATPHQIAFEEMFSQCVVNLIRILDGQGRHDEAIRLGRSALTLAPVREDIHVAVIRSLSESGHGSEAVRQFETLERLLDEQWGEAPSAEAVAALEARPTESQDRSATSRFLPQSSDSGSQSGGVRDSDPSALLIPKLSRRIFGRELDVEELHEDLKPSLDEFDRLWTVIGPGGCGKTVLAIAVAHDLQEDYEGRIVFVDLSTLRDPGLVLTRIAESLQIASPGSADARLRIQEIFFQLPHLLVMDNAEHLVPTISDLIDELLERCPKLRILTTSRRLLGLESERAYPITTLPFPSLNQDLSEVAMIPSVMLYIDRAKQYGLTSP